MRSILTHPWMRPAVAAALIIAAYAAGWMGSDVTKDALMVAAAVVAGTKIVISAVRALSNRVIGIDLLVSIATIGAVMIGEYWEAAAVTTLFAIGNALGAGTLNRTRRALSDLVDTAPEQAVVLRDGEPVTVGADEVESGGQVLVRTGARVPVDGKILEGWGALNEASITGESIPAEKTVADKVFAGTVSTAGMITVRADGIGGDTTLARIIRRVEEAQDAKAPWRSPSPWRSWPASAAAPATACCSKAASTWRPPRRWTLWRWTRPAPSPSASPA